MKEWGKHIVLFLICFGYCYGQEAKTLVGRNHFKVGEQTSLTYMLKLEQKQAVPFKPFRQMIPVRKHIPNSSLKNKDMLELEIMEKFHDTLIQGKAKEYIWIGGYTITAWDSGYFEIPEVVISFNQKEVVFPSTIIFVDLVPQKKGQDIYDIKESFTELPEQSLIQKTKDFMKVNWWWLLLIFTVGVIVWGYFRWKKVNRKPIQIREMSLKEKTLLAIEALENEKLWQKGKLKKHYVELSFILRSYLSSRYELNLLEKTTHETKLLLAQKGLNKDTIENIVRILSQSDMVKFAKSAPDELDVISNSVLVKQLVAETSPIEYKDVD